MAGHFIIKAAETERDSVQTTNDTGVSTLFKSLLREKQIWLDCESAFSVDPMKISYLLKQSRVGLLRWRENDQREEHQRFLTSLNGVVQEAREAN